MGRLGVVTLDGMKIAASASVSANRTEEHLARLAAEIAARHEEDDAAEDALSGTAAGDEVPVWSPRDRDQRIAAALAGLRADREAAGAAREQQVSQYLQAAEAGQATAGRAPDAARVRAAELRAARAEAAQAAKAEAWQEQRQPRSRPGPRGKDPAERV
jgi:hypothetical protein